MAINKIILSLGIIISTLSVGYYFVVYLPKVNDLKMAEAKKQLVMENQQKCRDAGQKAYSADVKMYGDNKLNEPQFTYNSELNTCLYGGGHNDTYKVCDRGLLSNCTRGSWERWVKDSYTNNKIISIVNWTTDGEKWSHTSEEITNFDDQYNKLMGF